MGKSFLLLILLCLISPQSRADDIDAVLSKYPASIKEQAKKLRVRSSITDLIPVYEMKCDDKFCRLWSKVSKCPSCCVQKCISSTCPEGKCLGKGPFTDDCNGSGWCSQPNSNSDKYINLNVFELLPPAMAEMYLSNKKISPSRGPKTLEFEDRREKYTINPIDWKTYEIISTTGNKQKQSVKIFDEEKIESLLLSSGLMYDFKRNQLTYKGLPCSIRSGWADLMKHSRKGGLCFMNGEKSGVYGVVFAGSELVPLRKTGGIDFCERSQFSISEQDPGCR